MFENRVRRGVAGFRDIVHTGSDAHAACWVWGSVIGIVGVWELVVVVVVVVRSAARLARA